MFSLPFLMIGSLFLLIANLPIKSLNTLVAEASYIQQETSDLIIDKDEFAKFSVMYAFDRVFNTNTCMDFLPFDNTILDDDLPF